VRYERKQGKIEKKKGVEKIIMSHTSIAYQVPDAIRFQSIDQF